MDDLKDFLLARIAEDEAVAQEATPGPWHMEPVVYGPPEEGWGAADMGDVTTGEGTGVVSHMYYEGGGASIKNAAHIARHDPARVLAECEAKRRIVEWMSDEVEYVVFGDDVLRALATVYADHPDYQPEWKL